MIFVSLGLSLKFISKITSNFRKKFVKCGLKNKKSYLYVKLTPPYNHSSHPVEMPQLPLTESLVSAHFVWMQRKLYLKINMLTEHKTRSLTFKTSSSHIQHQILSKNK